MGKDEKKKKKKKTKKQIQEELERQQEEARRLEELELLRQEEEERKRREAVKAAEEQAKLRRVAEQHRLKAERAEDEVYDKSRRRRVEQMSQEVQELVSWQEYLKCNPLPDVHDEAQLNTYVSMFTVGDGHGRLEDVKQDPHELLQSMGSTRLVGHVVRSCMTTERVLALLSHELAQALESNEPERIAHIQSYFGTLRRLSHDKIDRMTATIIREADELAKQGVAPAPIEYEEPGFTDVPDEFELFASPNVLKNILNADDYARSGGSGAGDGAVTVAGSGGAGAADAGGQTSGDKRAAGENVDPNDGQSRLEHKSDPSAAMNGSAGGHDAATGAAVNAASVSGSSSKGKNASTGDDTNDSAKHDKKGMRTPVWQVVRDYGGEHVKFGLYVHTSTKEPRTRAVQFRNIGVRVELPKSMQTRHPMALRVLQFGYDHVSQNARGSLVSVGGVFVLNQLRLPPPARMLKDWAIQEITPLNDTVEVMDYVNDDSDSVSTVQPFRVSFKLPDSLFLHGGAVSPRMGWFDAKQGQWREDGLTDVRYSPKSRSLQLSTVRLEPIAVIQPRALDFPYRSWSFVSASQQGATLNVEGSRFEIQIDVNRNWATLKSPQHEQLRHLRADNILPGDLLLSMAKSGINIVPTDADADFCRKRKRVAAVEARANAAIGTVAGLFDVRGSPWNNSLPADQCVFQVRRADGKLRLTDDEDDEEEEEEEQREAENDEEADNDDDADAADAEQRQQQSSEQKEAGDGDDAADSESKQPQRRSARGVDKDGWLTVMCTEEKFVFMEAVADDAMSFDAQELGGYESHVSFRRLLVSYFGDDLVPELDGVPMEFQLATTRLFNLVRVLTFH